MSSITIENHKIPECVRRSFMVNSFDALEMGDSIIIYSQYDPLELWIQFNEHRPAQFCLEYLIQGPHTWKVKLTKQKKNMDSWWPMPQL